MMSELPIVSSSDRRSSYRHDNLDRTDNDNLGESKCNGHIAEGSTVDAENKAARDSLSPNRHSLRISGPAQGDANAHGKLAQLAAWACPPECCCGCLSQQTCPDRLDIAVPS